VDAVFFGLVEVSFDLLHLLLKLPRVMLIHLAQVVMINERKVDGLRRRAERASQHRSDNGGETSPWF
jgi:hypothetical protein